jgi:hypothetical protein
MLKVSITVLDLYLAGRSVGMVYGGGRAVGAVVWPTLVALNEGLPHQ